MVLCQRKECDCCSISPLRKDELVPQVKPSILNDWFVCAFTEDDSFTLPSLGSSPYPDVPESITRIEGFKETATGLNSHKASGSDTLPIRFLKKAVSEVAPALQLIFDASLSHVKFTDDWKNSRSHAKKADRSTLSNYSPTSLTAVCSKVIEHILHSVTSQRNEKAMKVKLVTSFKNINSIYW